MRCLHLTVVMMLFPVLAFSQGTVSARMVDDGGAGPYKAVITSCSSLPDYTIYRPARMQAALEKTTLPLIVFANGKCDDNSSRYERFLSELASFGYFIAAVGPYRDESDGSVGSISLGTESLTKVIDAVFREVSDSGSEFYGMVDTNHVAVMGHSCGGVQAIAASADPRITTTISLNGAVPEKNLSSDGTLLEAIHSPVLFLMGGEDDPAYLDSVANIEDIDNAFAVMLSYPSGSDGTFSEQFGGACAMMTLEWLEWQLKDVMYARGIFTGEECLCAYTQWSMQNHNLDFVLNFTDEEETVIHTTDR